MRMRALIAALALLSLAAAPTAAAKASPNGAIKGTVTNNTGGVLKQVKVIAFNLDTGVAYESKSDEKGNYEFPDLPRGDYELTAIAEGYDIYGSGEIKVEEKRPVTFDITMQQLFPRSESSIEDP